MHSIEMEKGSVAWTGRGTAKSGIAKELNCTGQMKTRVVTGGVLRNGIEVSGNGTAQDSSAKQRQGNECKAQAGSAKHSKGKVLDSVAKKRVHKKNKDENKKGGHEK